MTVTGLPFKPEDMTTPARLVLRKLCGETWAVFRVRRSKAGRDVHQMAFIDEEKQARAHFRALAVNDERAQQWTGKKSWKSKFAA